MENTGKTEEQVKSRVCKRCKTSYNPSSNDASSCRFHPSFFVCRRHDDQKRYYELGPDDPPYAAKFYDCCGAEDPEALGCTTSFHISNILAAGKKIFTFFKFFESIESIEKCT
ncbi:uncharacterized protein LOC108210799 isoform X1 [Daucus carota subsp. sativus]|uniref:uncharacterized protein LOC108210799 isoform X1 n=1 Tax=Daucus carota subsp. sativus TaxID=79200 RepID=UPI0007F01C9F|nr:PREDICTED: uncharacterized protein LOC108210799 isoform X1 [Daucus carota subsp. sativus]